MSRNAVLGLLALDGVLSAVAGALLMPVFIGPVPFPLSALLSGLCNAALVWAAGNWSGSRRLAALPLWTWLATAAVFTLGGPGGDIVFGGSGIMGYSALIFLVLGALPATLVLRRMSEA
ncbi:MAG: hypothetical protein ACR2JM_15855 [Mycobacterium sp.]